MGRHGALCTAAMAQSNAPCMHMGCWSPVLTDMLIELGQCTLLWVPGKGGVTGQTIPLLQPLVANQSISSVYLIMQRVSSCKDFPWYSALETLLPNVNETQKNCTRPCRNGQTEKKKRNNDAEPRLSFQIPALDLSASGSLRADVMPV